MDDQNDLPSRRNILAAAATLPVSIATAASAQTTEQSLSFSQSGTIGQVDTVVVGAGFAGLSAAAALAQQGRSVLILEARNRVGGRVAGETIAGLRLDMGGMWIGPGQHRLLALAQRLGARLYPTPLFGQSFFQIGQRAGLVAGEDFTPILQSNEQEDLGAAFAAIDQFTATISADSPWMSPQASSLDETTMRAWINTQCQTDAIRDFFQNAVEAVVGRKAEEVSLLSFLWYLRSNGNLTYVQAFQNGAQQWLVDGSLSALADRLANELAGRIWLNTKVESIEQSSRGVVVGTARGAVIARRAIVAMPPHLAARIDYRPTSLSGAKDSLACSIGLGHVIKCVVVYPTPFWRTQGLNGFSFGRKSQLLQPTFDISPTSSGRGVLAGFIEGNLALRWDRINSRERSAAVIEDLARVFGPQARRPLGYSDFSWVRDPFSRGGYGHSLPTGVLASVGPVLREPFGRVHFAGAETAVEFCGYIEGAMESGQRAANEVLRMD
jgi:monoamine oxidase